MERLTFDGRFCDIAMCRELSCPYENNCTQKEVWERLKQYEDTGYTPGEIAKLQGDLLQRNAELLEARQNLSETRYRVEYMDRDLKEACQKITNMKSRCVDMKNELCQYCGKYKNAHEGACDGCRWREM